MLSHSLEKISIDEQVTNSTLTNTVGTQEENGTHIHANQGQKKKRKNKNLNHMPHQKKPKRSIYVLEKNPIVLFNEKVHGPTTPKITVDHTNLYHNRRRRDVYIACDKFSNLHTPLLTAPTDVTNVKFLPLAQFTNNVVGGNLTAESYWYFLVAFVNNTYTHPDGTLTHQLEPATYQDIEAIQRNDSHLKIEYKTFLDYRNHMKVLDLAAKGRNQKKVVSDDRITTSTTTSSSTSRILSIKSNQHSNPARHSSSCCDHQQHFNKLQEEHSMLNAQHEELKVKYTELAASYALLLSQTNQLLAAPRQSLLLPAPQGSAAPSTTQTQQLHELPRLPIMPLHSRSAFSVVTPKSKTIEATTSTVQNHNVGHPLRRF